MDEDKKIYIGNLEYSVKDSTLKALLEEKGIAVKDIKVITDKFTGKSKGFGFAEFDTEEETQKAIDALNGQDVNGRALKVNKARQMVPHNNKFGDMRPRRKQFE